MAIIEQNCPYCGTHRNLIKIRKNNRTIINGTVQRNCYCYCPKCDARSGRELYCNYETREQAEDKAIDNWNERK